MRQRIGAAISLVAPLATLLWATKRIPCAVQARAGAGIRLIATAHTLGATFQVSLAVQIRVAARVALIAHLTDGVRAAKHIRVAVQCGITAGVTLFAALALAVGSTQELPLTIGLLHAGSCTNVALTLDDVALADQLLDTVAGRVKTGVTGLTILAVAVRTAELTHVQAVITGIRFLLIGHALVDLPVKTSRAELGTSAVSQELPAVRWRLSATVTPRIDAAIHGFDVARAATAKALAEMHYRSDDTAAV